jgi:hypothetical protein
MYFQSSVPIEDIQIIAPEIDLDGLIHRKQIWETMSPEAQKTFKELIIEQEIEELKNTKLGGKKSSQKLSSIYDTRRMLKYLKKKHGTKQKASQILTELQHFSREL